MESGKHELFMDLACACDGLFPLPVEGKAIMESDKDELFMDLACACDGFFPLPAKEKARTSRTG